MRKENKTPGEWGHDSVSSSKTYASNKINKTLAYTYGVSFFDYCMARLEKTAEKHNTNKLPFVLCTQVLANYFRISRQVAKTILFQLHKNKRITISPKGQKILDGHHVIIESGDNQDV